MKKFKILLLISVLILLIPLSLSTVRHSIKVQKDNALINTTLELKSERKVNYWRLSWIKPSNSEIISIEDSYGEIDDYEVDGKNIKIITNKGDSRKEGEVKIRLEVKDLVKKEFKPLRTISLNLAGFKNETSRVFLKTNGLLSGSYKAGFKAYFSNKTTKLKGKGPLNFKVSFADKKPNYDNFLIFEDYNISLADNFYSYITAVTGTKPPFERFPIVVLPESEYNEKLNSWSAGMYKRGGIIFIRKSNMEKRTNTSLLIHEATHGFNEQVLRWDNTNVRWFDEGVAKYMEYLVNQKLGVVQAEIFGGTTYFMREGSNYRLSPRGTPEDLWNYYKENKSFMKEWTPYKDRNREFGYAFSELLIREYMKNNGYDSLRPVYNDLGEIKLSTNKTDLKNRRILNALGTDLKPCYMNDKEGLEDCLDEIHNQNPEIPSLEGLNFSDKELETDFEEDNGTKLEENKTKQGENKTKEKDKKKGGEEENDQKDGNQEKEKGFFDMLFSAFISLIESICSILFP